MIMADFDPGLTQPASATPTAVDATPSSAIMSTPVAQPTTSAAPVTSPAPGSPQAPATGAPGDGWVPSWRLRETRENVLKEARTFFEQKENEFKTREQEYQAKIQALAGFGPKPNPEVEAVRDQFGNLYPGLAKLEKRAADLLQMIERSGDMDAQSSHYWTNYGQQAVNKLFAAAEADLGQPLNEEGKAYLHAQFVGFIQSSPERVNSYASDPGFVDQYWKAFSSNFIDPVRRVSAASAQGRIQTPLPQDTSAAAPRIGGPEKPANLEDRVSRSWTAYQQTAKR